MKRMNSLPNFIICGTQKGGTTSLYTYLKQNPFIGMSNKKEIHYFDLHYQKGIEWYKKHFKKFKDKKYKLVGEATPTYMYFENIPERIYRLIPETKLIFILRNPVNRAYSHYWHTVKIGYEYLYFEEAIEKEEERLREYQEFIRSLYSYKDRGKYISQLERFWKYFPKEQMLILITEELKEKPEQVMTKLFDFLEINVNTMSKNWYLSLYKGKQPRIWQLQSFIGMLPNNSICNLSRRIFKYLNFKNGYPAMDPETKQKLISYFRPYNKELEKKLGRKITYWDK